MKSSVKNAVVLEETQKPDFDTFDILEVTDNFYSKEQIEIAKFICEYYFSSFGEAISLFLPYSFASSSRLTSSSSSGLTRGSIEIVDSCLRRNDKSGSSPRMAESVSEPKLSDAQQQAYDQLLQKNKALLFGVTGSGKTEIFISLMAKIVKEGKRSIFLMPEISLTPQMEKRLKAYFGERVAMWHSKLTKAKKEQILADIYSGKISIVAGARSALFVPLSDVGLIIVDEEHDDSYKAMSRPRYHARDVAVLMGQKLHAKVVLASATPSLGSYYKYPMVKIEKPFVATDKSYRFVEGASLGGDIIRAVRENYQKGGQGVLFLPTRGNFKYLYCESCGKTHLCPYCSVGMALHRSHRHLRCHYCGYTEAIAQACVHCGHHPLKSERMGTKEAIEILTEQIPEMSIEQFDKDSITTAKKLTNALARFESGESRLLLGTQMLSKGHDYANVTLSVIMGLDHILGLADYRAKERAMSLLVQIAGRSGRAKSATVLIQTGNQELFVPYLRDYEQFLRDELEFARDLYPPFVSLARILIAHKEEAKARDLCVDITGRLALCVGIELVGHGKAPIERIAGKYRYHILLRSQRRTPLLTALHSVDQRGIEIDMDPVDFS